jgi:hypothetical protein
MKTRNIYLSLIAILVVAGGIVYALTSLRARQEVSSQPPPAPPAAESEAPASGDGKPAPEGCDFGPANPLVATTATDYVVKAEPTKIEETGSLPDGVKFRIVSSGCVDALTYEVDLQSTDDRAKRSSNEWLKWASDEVALLPFRSMNEFADGFKRLMSTPDPIKFVVRSNEGDIAEVCNDGSSPSTGDKCTTDDGSEVDCPHECNWDEGYGTSFEVKPNGSGTTAVLTESTPM